VGRRGRRDAALRIRSPEEKHHGNPEEESTLVDQDGQGPVTQAAPPTEAASQRLSALDAAAKVLAETGQPMRCTELIAAMTAKGYWTSPAGKTPASTLYAAFLRELRTKKDQARFRKTERGRFGLA
jgi:hypothetical protein